MCRSGLPQTGRDSPASASQVHRCPWLFRLLLKRLKIVRKRKKKFTLTWSCFWCGSLFCVNLVSSGITFPLPRRALGIISCMQMCLSSSVFVGLRSLRTTVGCVSQAGLQGRPWTPDPPELSSLSWRQEFTTICLCDSGDQSRDSQARISSYKTELKL